MLVAAIHERPADRGDEEHWYGEWTVKEIIGHLSAWEDGAAAALELLARNRDPRVPGFDGDGEAFNAAQAATHHDDSWDEAMQCFDDSRQRFLRALLGLYGVDAERMERGRLPRA